MTWPTRKPRRKKAVARDPITRRISKPSEHLLQVRLLDEVSYKLAPGVFIFAVPNQGKRSINNAMKMKAEGLRAGVTDLVVMMPGGRTGFLEMKIPGGRLSPSQKEFRDRCNLLGHPWAVAFSVEEAMVYLRSWGALRENAMQEAAE